MSGELKALPAIPAKRYFTIGEVSELCGVKSYVLRYWEQEFTQLRPMKRRGNRRYYQHHEVLLIRRIRELLYDQGFTISGARNQLIEAGIVHPQRAMDDDEGIDPALDEGEGAAGESGASSAASPGGANVGATDEAFGAAAEAFGKAADEALGKRGVGALRTHADKVAGDSAALRAELLAIRALLVG